MKRKQIETMTIQELLEIYVELCTSQLNHQGDIDAEGRLSVRAWNRYHKKIELVHRELKKRGDEGLDALVTLFDHENRNVRHTAVVHALKQRTDQALPVLEAMARDDDAYEVAIWPAHTLRLWRSGRWMLD